MTILTETLLITLNNTAIGQGSIDYSKILGDIIPASALVVSILVFLIYLKQTNIQVKMFELANKQKEIQEKELEYFDKQLILQKLNFEPKFQIKSELARTEKNEGIYDTEFLQIDNDGYYISDYKSTIETFYSFKDNNMLRNATVETIFQVFGYFGVGSFMGSKTNQKGTLETRYDFKNNLRFTDLYFETIKQSNSEHIYSISIFTLIKISYKNYEGVSQVKYFNKATTSYEITEEDYRTIKAMSIISHPIEYSDLNFDKVVELTNTNQNT